MSKRRCFITAPYGLDLSAVQHALEKHGVSWQWAENLPSGVSLMEAVSTAIQDADFLLAISSESTLSPNSFLEIGYALGREIPVVLLTTESFKVPFDLATLRHLKTDLNDPRLLDFQIQLLLRSLDLPKGKRKSAKATTSRQPQARKVAPQLYASGLEEAVATAVIAAGGRVTLPERGSKEQASADFLMWFPEIDKELFNPAAIEVRSKIELPTIADIHARLGQFVTSFGFGCGLIVSEADVPSRLPHLIPFPNIFIITRHRFEEALRSRELGAWVRHERNRLVHGVR